MKMAEKEYIERDEILQKISKMIEYCKKDNKVNGLTALFQVGDAIIDCKSADVQEVVRCKDCMFRVTCYIRHEDVIRSEYGFCSRGARMDGKEVEK